MLPHQKPVIPGCAQPFEIFLAVDPTLGDPNPVGRQLGRYRLHAVGSHLEGREVSGIDA